MCTVAGSTPTETSLTKIQRLPQTFAELHKDWISLAQACHNHVLNNKIAASMLALSYIF